MTALPTELLGRYEQQMWKPPLWLVFLGLVIATALAAGNLVLGQYRAAAGPTAMVIVVAVCALAARRQRPAAVEVTSAGVVVELPYRTPRTVAWTQVNGVRVLSRRSAPQLLLTSGSQEMLLGLPDEVARQLALHLPALLGRPVTFLVDAHEVDPTTASV